MQKPTLLVLAAGMGSRYGGLKQIDPVGPAGEIIIDYSMFAAILAGFGKVVFVIRRDIEQTFREVVGSKFDNHLPVEYAFQELTNIPAPFTVPAGRTKPWGTGHAILAAESVIHEPFAMINADDFYGTDTFRVLADYLRQVSADSNAYAMVGFTLRKTLSDHGTVARGVCQVDNAGKLKQIVELLKIEKTATGARQGDQTLTGDEPVSMNFWGFTPTLFGHLRRELQQFLKQQGQEEKSELLIPMVIGDLVAQNRATCQVLRTTASWFGVTYREDRPIVIENIRKLIAAGEYPASLWK
ncbi:MAG: sugar phosphate nucleotidyltransferase [Verrucomicrobiota bacterium]